MIGTESILFAAILVFGLMLVGIVLTALEFKKMERGSESEGQSQKEFANRHTARIVPSNEQEMNQV